MIVGKKDWIIPDCELPPEGEGVLKGHESVVIVNDSNEKAIIKVKLYFDYMNTISGLSSVPQLSGDLLEERGTLNRMTSTGNKILYVLDSYLVYGICDLSEDPNFNIFTDAFSDYALSGLILSGTGENAETELFETYDIVAEEYVTRTAPTSGSIKLDLGLAADAGDSFEGKTLSVKITVQAMQLRNTGEDTWEDMFTETYYVD